MCSLPVFGLRTNYGKGTEDQSVQFSAWLCLTLWPHGLQQARPPCPSPISGIYSNSCPLSQWYHLILCCPLFLPPSIFHMITVFSNESALRIRCLEYWHFSFNISTSNEHSGLISFRIDGLDLFAVQGTLRVSSNTTVQKHQSLPSL